MSENLPDRWVLVKINKKGKDPIYKVFATWYGGYLSGEAWKLNSGIDRVSISKKKGFTFYGRSGSRYVCRKRQYGTSVYTSMILSGIITQGEQRGVEVVPLTEQEALDWIKRN